MFLGKRRKIIFIGGGKIMYWENIGGKCIEKKIER